ncbi:aminotransferase class III-fold pyridoxal phosphate-dependent enzyme [Alkaliphilus pronyensis]|uniref:Aminotransferase class III-fold pyridoxal phosphate-dependent enzyme n=1 Tax=Alkaliphilus pronyensis TaxID=1482732 RepID=A0A6I0F029_9FIRM|nr:aminotransferase class III-fold pyridoxal phosphate-dependent enzyme [Alkaliphilus pronyensis]KAB3533488.1 aminotransferase class III-fold pyridoxal phosphate-dependent enzyme [Alkaliphilus pronyensis]
MRKNSDRRLKMFEEPEASLTITKTLGTKITTKEYGELIDFQSGCWAAIIGHNRREITDAIKENVDILMHTHQFFDTGHPTALIKKLEEAANLKSSYKGAFLSSGSEAVSLAVKLSEIITGRRMKLSLSISYHGATADLRLPRDQQLWTDLDVAQCLSCSKNIDCRECGNFSYIDFTHFASFVFEAGNSGGLVLCPPQKLIAYLAEEVRAAGGYVVANEVTTGFGRTGKWFGFQHYDYFNNSNTSPDFIALGKGLGNGYPISGLLVISGLASILEETGFRYVQSHIDDPLGCIIARSVIEIIKKEGLIDIGNETGNYLRGKLMEVYELVGGIKEIRGRGMMNIVVLEDNCSAKEVFKHLLEYGVFTGYSEAYNYIHLYPPLTLKTNEVDHLAESLQIILSERIVR